MTPRKFFSIILTPLSITRKFSMLKLMSSFFYLPPTPPPPKNIGAAKESSKGSFSFHYKMIRIATCNYIFVPSLIEISCCKRRERWDVEGMKACCCANRFPSTRTVQSNRSKHYHSRHHRGFQTTRWSTRQQQLQPSPHLHCTHLHTALHTPNAHPTSNEQTREKHRSRVQERVRKVLAVRRGMGQGVHRWRGWAGRRLRV